jgi:hypothetical protein
LVQPSNPKYSTIVADDVGDETLTFSASRAGGKVPTTLKDIVDTLSEISTSTINDWESRINSAFDKKRGIDLSKVDVLKPGISVSEKYVLLPDTVSDKPDNLIISMMGSLAKQLGFVVKLIPYGEKRIADVSERQWKIAAGMSFVNLDLNRKLLVKWKEDPYELGRAFSRAQQTMGVFGADDNLGLEALKRSHRFYGNNPGEMEGDSKSKTRVTYMAKELATLFIEEEWREELRVLLCTLLRRSHILLTDEVRSHIILENVLPYSDAVLLYGTRDVVVTPATGKRPAVTAKRVPKKPSVSALLQKPEQSFVEMIAADLFKAVDITSKEDYISAVKMYGFKAIKDRISSKTTKRAEFLSKFASLTTERLKSLRKLTPALKTKRKRDIVPDDVQSLLNSRTDLYGDFATEVARLDPTFSGILSGVARRDANTNALDFTATRARLINHMYSQNIYDGVRPIPVAGNPLPQQVPAPATGGTAMQSTGSSTSTGSAGPIPTHSGGTHRIPNRQTVDEWHTETTNDPLNPQWIARLADLAYTSHRLHNIDECKAWKRYCETELRNRRGWKKNAKNADKTAFAESEYETMWSEYVAQRAIGVNVPSGANLASGGRS